MPFKSTGVGAASRCAVLVGLIAVGAPPVARGAVGRRHTGADGEGGGMVGWLTRNELGGKNGFERLRGNARLSLTGAGLLRQRDGWWLQHQPRWCSFGVFKLF